MGISEPLRVSLKHHSKREVLQLIDQMEECFNQPFVFDPDKVEARQGKVASAIPLGHWFYGIDVHGQSRKYKTHPGDVPTLNAAMYGFESEGEYSRVQAYLKAHGGWQLEAVSIVHFHSLGRQLDRTGHLLLTVVMRTGHLLLTVVMTIGRLDGLLYFSLMFLGFNFRLREMVTVCFQP